MSTIRVVEDNEDLVSMFSVMLSRNGWDIAPLRLPEDCLRPEAWEGVALGVVDLMMPGTPGIQVLRYVREHHPSVKLLVVTAAAEHTRQEAVEWSDHMLRKPFDLEELLRVVTSLIGPS